MDLVILKKNDCFTTSEIIAEGTKRTHEAIQKIISKHENRFKTFGKVGFEIRPLEKSKTGQKSKIYILNEQQTTFLLTLMRNTDIVLDFKEKLVKEFYKMRQFILEKSSQAWIETRKQGKLTRKEETDTIKELVEYAKEQGSKNANMLYMTYSKLANKMAGIDKRDSATVMELNNLSLIEHIILNVIRQGMNENKHYKQIYQKSKQALITFNNVAYLEVG